MLNNKHFSFALAVAAVAFSVCAFTSAANAQGRYANVYSRNQVSDIIRRAEDSSDRFRTDFRNQMNQNHGLSNNQKDQYNRYVAQNEESLDRLRDHFNKNNSWWESRNQVRDVISASQNVNTMMNALPFRRYLEAQWKQVRNDINTLGDTFDLPGLDGGGWNGGGGSYPGGGGGYPGGGGNIPSWALGTFYARNPQTGGLITMTVSRNGSVALSFDGNSPIYARMNGNILTNGEYVSRVTRLGDGIRTTSTTNGDRIDYFKTAPGNGGGWNPPGQGGGGNVPDWALGTFYARNPQTGGTISMTIDRRGSVQISFDGNPPINAYMKGTTLINGQYTNRVTQLRNGIRTTNVANNDYIDYYHH